MLKTGTFIHLFILLFLPFTASLNAQAVSRVWVKDQRKALGGDVLSVAYCVERDSVICLTRDQIASIDKNGEIASLVSFQPGQRGNISKGGEFINVMTYDHDTIARYELMDLDKNIESTIEPTTGHGSFLAGRDGQMIIGITFERGRDAADGPRTYHFYNRLGGEQGSVTDRNPTSLTMAPDGNALVINDMGNALRAYSKTGSQLWATDEPYKYFKASNGALRVIGNLYNNRNQVVLLGQGSTIGDTGLNGAVQVLAISPGGEFAAATDAETLRCYNSQMDELWRYAVEDEAPYVQSISIADNGMLACGLFRDIDREPPSPDRTRKGFVLLFDGNGRNFWKKTYSLKRTNAWIPVVDLSPITQQKTKLTVKTRENIYLYDIVE